MPKKIIILHPFLFTVSPILFFFSFNKDELSLLNGDFLITLGTTLLASFIFWLLLSKTLKDKQKAAIIVSILVLLFFSYGHIRKFIEDFNFELAGFNIGPDKTLLSVWGAIAVLGSYLTVKTKKDLYILTNFLNVVAATAVLISIIDIVPYKIKTGSTEGPSTASQQTEEITVEATPEEIATLPDIYYLIFDRYANETTLKEYFNFDNSEFLNFLQEKDFYVASKSYANYPKTLLSLASSLNLEHLGYLTKQLGEDNDDKTPVYEMLQDYKVWRFLKKRGYQFIHFGDWWSGTKKNKYADENINYFSTINNEFLTKFLETTIVHPISQRIFSDLPYRNTTRKRHLFKFDKLAEMADLESPKFVFAHMLLPHDPYVFDQDGSPIKKEQDIDEREKENYINQLIFTNNKIEVLIDQLLEKSQRPPIIIIQSDEGPFTPEYHGGGGPEDWSTLNEQALKVYMRIINAYYLPEFDKKTLYPSITPVNSFRIIFDHYFGTNYKLLPDESYIFKSLDQPYKFINVTDKVKFN